jgi:hypothetical protein
VITSSADDDVRAFSEAFRLKPSLAPSTSVLGRRKFGNDALKLVIRAGLEKRGGVAGELLAKQEWVFA